MLREGLSVIRTLLVFGLLLFSDVVFCADKLGPVRRKSAESDGPTKRRTTSIDGLVCATAALQGPSGMKKILATQQEGVVEESASESVAVLVDRTVAQEVEAATTVAAADDYRELVVAVKVNDCEAVKAYFAQHPEALKKINDITVEGKTLLRFAVECARGFGTREIVYYLFENSAQILWWEKSFFHAVLNPSGLVFQKKGFQRVINLIQCKDSWDSCVESLDVASFSKCFSQKIFLFLNTQDLYGQSALHYAVWRNRPDIVQLFLSQPDINPNLQDIWGATPLHDAYEYGREKIIALLEAHPRIDKTLENNFGRTPAMMQRAK